MRFFTDIWRQLEVLRSLAGQWNAIVVCWPHPHPPAVIVVGRR